MEPWPDRQVVRIEECRLTSVPMRWAYADDRADDVARHWQRRLAENPSYFNGTIYMLARHRLDGTAFDGEMTSVEFRQFLYWRENGSEPSGLRDCFGSGLIRSTEGHVILGRQRPGNINAGLAYLPGGFIDPRDVAPTGAIDLPASVEREVAEETGLGNDVVERVPGFLFTFAGPMLSIAVEFRSRLRSEELAARVRKMLARDPKSELEDVVIVRDRTDAATLAMPDFARILLGHVLSER